MNNRINLLVPEQHDALLERRIRILRFISLSFLFVIVLSAVGLFFLILSSPLPRLRSEELQAQAELQTLQKTSGTLFLVRERLGHIDGIINNRLPIEAVVKKIQSRIPTFITIDRLTYEDSTVTIILSSTSLLFLDSTITNIKGLKDEGKEFSSMKLSSVAFDNERRVYIATIALQI